MDEYKRVFSEQIGYLNSLSEESLFALEDYVADSRYNEFLTGKFRVASSDDFMSAVSLVSRLDEIFEKCPPLKTSITVYRGVWYDDAGAYKPSYKHLCVFDKGFVSTSFNMKTARGFVPGKDGCCVLQLTIPKGTRVLPLATHGSIPAEQEVLLPRSGKICLTRQKGKLVFGIFTAPEKYQPPLFRDKDGSYSDDSEYEEVTETSDSDSDSTDNTPKRRISSSVTAGTKKIRNV